MPVPKLTRHTYKAAGVDIGRADQVKQGMRTALEPTDVRVLNRLGAFSSLFRLDFPLISDPVLVLKMEEPGSKQLLALERRRYRGIAYDTVNHLLNDVMVMGAVPFAVLDAIICGELDPDIVGGLVAAFADACREQECSLVGGETSEQPRVLERGRYVLTAAACGIVSASKIIDGSAIRPGDRILAVASNGFHTNGYSLLRRLLDEDPTLADTVVGDAPFIDRLLLPHLCYGVGLRSIFALPGTHGLAHITGGGIRDNLRRILPANVHALIDLNRIRTLDVFSFVKRRANTSDDEMLRVFNCGVGLVCVVASENSKAILEAWQQTGFEAYELGEIRDGEGGVLFEGQLLWR